MQLYFNVTKEVCVEEQKQLHERKKSLRRKEILRPRDFF
jgi:hypothetical protein